MTPPPRALTYEVGSGLEIHYREAGQGRPVMFIHGSGPGGNGWSNFKQNIDPLAANYRVVVPDLYGYGYSAKPEGCDYDLDFFASGLTALMDGLGLEDVTVVGNSLGGAIAIKLALTHPQRLRALVLMAPGGIESTETYMKMAGIQRMVGEIMKGPLDKPRLRGILEMFTYDKKHVTDALVEERFAISQTQPPDVFGRMKVENQGDRLQELTIPILGLWGANDEFCPPSGSYKFLMGCPQARFTFFSRCGHWVMIEYAAAFNRLCLDFLAND